MRIANPIYDVVFKYLMEDTEIARKLLSEIIGENITQLSLEPQELIVKSDKFEVIILRLDFKAKIKGEDGEYKKVLIELQKGKDPSDILRFRKYLGDNYRKEDTFVKDGLNVKESLPIITIYFLGFLLKSIKASVLKVNREYIDLINNKEIPSKEEFIEKLTHNSYIIQILRIGKKDRTELERILKIFNQSYVTDDKKIMEISEKELEGSELLQKMAERLRKAATEEDILKKLEIEEEVENTIENHIREKQNLKEKNEELKDQNEELKDENEELKKKLKELEDKLKNED